MFEGTGAVSGLDSTYKGHLFSNGVLFPSWNSSRFKQAAKIIYKIHP